MFATSHLDHGSILITSRPVSLQKHGLGVKVGTVAVEQARAILEINAGREIKASPWPPTGPYPGWLVYSGDECIRINRNKILRSYHLKMRRARFLKQERRHETERSIKYRGTASIKLDVPHLRGGTQGAKLYIPRGLNVLQRRFDLVLEPC
ncbi:hypothetical protein B0J11DRAFT_512285 [Dendryphion nanum]|uniref:Uncharacterized protein n=1 Tax=Dendryphion nanum TaxID=256645 RepID=A0A9P9D1Q3_9PLEO|nr:hypothetical protein B0J11DRAFT_512285 [Dendryphion nanum]